MSRIVIGNITNSTFAIGDGAFVIVDGETVITGVTETEETEETN